MRSTDASSRCPSPHGSMLSGVAVVVFLFTLLGMGGCETLHTGSDYDRTAVFSSYRTFTWLPRSDYGTGNPLIVERAREAILAALEAKGYGYVNTMDAANFAVDFTIGSRERVDVQTYPRPFAGPWLGYGPYWWGYPYWGSGVDVRHYREGTLSIDVFDAHTHRPVWHGWAKKALSRQDMTHSRTAIGEAVAAVLAKFPPP